MRILHIINSLDIGGAETVLAGLLENISDEHHVVVLQSDGPLGRRVGKAAASVTYVGASKSSRDVLKMVKGLQQAVDKVRPDILHSHLVHSDFISLMVRPRGARRVTSIHVATLQSTDPLRSRVVARIVGHLSRFFAMAIATSDRSLQYMDGLGYRCPRTVIINGTPAVQEVDFRQDRVVFLSLARFNAVKGHPILLEAFLGHLESHPASRLVCAGAGVELTNPEFTTMLGSVGITDPARLPIDFLGPQMNIAALFARASALVISSRSEAFPMVGSEACMHGIPVITTDVGGCRIFALREELLIQPGSVAALTRAMNYFAELPPNERNNLSVESRQLGLDKFDIRVTASAYCDVYRGVLNNSPA